MAELARNDQVIDMVDYLRETIGEIDAMVLDLQKKRTGLAIRLAALEAATDTAVLQAADDYERRRAENRPYEGAEDAEKLITEAHKRFVP